MLRMANAASQQALEVGKERLREFLETSDTGRQAMAMSSRKLEGDNISLQTLDSEGRRRPRPKPTGDEDEDEEDEI